MVAGGALIAAALYWLFSAQLWAVPAAVVAAIVLAMLVRQYRRLTSDWQRASTLALINRHGVARQQRDWNALPEPHPIIVPPTHPYAGDLDIVGKASLLQLLDTTGTTLGGERLVSWLLEPATPEEIPQRQEAVRELAADFGWLQELQQRALLGEIDDEDTAEFLTWATQPASRLPLLTWLARASVAATVAVLALSIARVVDSGWLILPFMANLLIASALHRKAGKQMDAAMEHGNAIRAYAGLLELLDHKPCEAQLLQAIAAPLQTGGVAASEAAEQLAKILSFGVPRGSLQSYALQFFCAWDVHFFDRLEGWRERYGTHVPQWLEAIGWYEALGALANLAHDNPHWVYPDVSPDHDRVSGGKLGHPLIPESRRVCNDVTLGPPGTFLFVTGSNMSGKSTLLRSIGIDTVLANTGGPACAETLTLPPISLWTSVRIVDSLEMGVSYYMAELLRLKQIVDASASPQPNDRTICFLLDEILSGTNTAERQIAARRIISLLIERGAIGAVSTHDLDLLADSTLSDAAQAVHLAETVHQRDGQMDMTFDYSVRPGLATSTNALKLMELVGIPLEDATVPQR